MSDAQIWKCLSSNMACVPVIRAVLLEEQLSWAASDAI